MDEDNEYHYRIRKEIECCNTCENGHETYHGNWKCLKFDEEAVEPLGICDYYKRWYPNEDVGSF